MEPSRKRARGRSAPPASAASSASASSASATMTRFTNCRVVRGGELVAEDLWVQEGVVVDPKKKFWAAQSATDFVDGGVIVDVDCGGAIVAPGFIDVQINGAFGVDFADPANITAERLRAVGRGLLAHGVVAFLPTLVSSPSAVYRDAIARFQAIQKLAKERSNGSGAGAAEEGEEDLGAEILGLHLEGPFMNVAKKGAHRQDNLRDPSEGMVSVSEIYGECLDGVSLVTLAPELPGALSAISGLAGRGVAVSMGHTMATIDEGLAGRRAGASLITHLFNAMPSFHHRDPGLVGLLGVAEADRPYYSLIADGLHCHAASIKIATRSHPKGAILVTDAIAAMGLGDGDHSLGEQRVTVQHVGESMIRATLTGSDTLAGACVPMDQCCRNFIKATQCSVPEMVAAASTRPARLLFGGDTLRGTLLPGAPADVVLLSDDEAQVGPSLLKVYRRGLLAWEAPQTGQEGSSVGSSTSSS